MKKVRSILLIIIFPVLGVIGFQVYWILNAYKVNEELFHSEVSTILFEAIEYDVFNQVGVNIDSIETNIPGSGEIIIDQLIFPDDPAELQDVLDYLENPHPIDPENISIQITDRDSFPMEDSTIIYDTPQEFGFGNSFPEMLYDIFTDFMGTEPRMEAIDSLFKNKLVEKGIDVDYSMALYENNRLIKATRGNSASFKSSDITVKTYRYDVDSPEIRVNIAQKASFLLMNMWVAFFTSFILVVVVIGSFTFMLSFILRQKKLSDMKNDFISSMTHELKTPIATVSAAVEAMQHFGALDDRVRTDNYLSISGKELKRLGIMVEKVLDISAYEKHKVSPNKEIIHLNPLITEIVDRFRLQNEKTVSILEFLSGDLVIFADIMHIRNMLNNLLDNAVKYCNTKPEISISSRVQYRTAELRIKDNGIGIAKDYLNQIFDKFYRVPGKQLHTVTGFGLGLSYVKYVVEEHKGHIHVTSKPGSGSIFLIKIPLYDGNN